MINHRKQPHFPLSEPGTFGGLPIRHESANETAQAQIDSERAAAEAAAFQVQEEQRRIAERNAAQAKAAEAAALKVQEKQRIAEQQAAAARVAEALRIKIAAERVQFLAAQTQAREEAAAQEAEERRRSRRLRVRRAAYRRRRELALQPPPLPPGASPLEYHQRNCTICAHPERKHIEESFLRWDSPVETADEYEISRSAIYRHADALGLFARRNRNVRFALGHVIEEAARVMPTADAVIRAVRAFTRVNDDGQWVDPPQHFILSAGPRMSGNADLPIGLPLAQFTPQLESQVDTDKNASPAPLALATSRVDDAEHPSTQTGTASWTQPSVTP
jgi:hypothetical protein